MVALLSRNMVYAPTLSGTAYAAPHAARAATPTRSLTAAATQAATAATAKAATTTAANTTGSISTTRRQHQGLERHGRPGDEAVTDPDSMGVTAMAVTAAENGQ